MSYTRDIPQPGDNLSISQGQILGNFQALDDIFDLNHYKYDYSVSGDRGLHRKVDFPATNTVSAPSGLASVVYTKNVSNVASPYFRNAVGDNALWYGGSGNGSMVSSFGGNKSSGYMQFPNGFIMQWGNNTQVSGDTITFPIAFPNACFEVIPSIFKVTTGGTPTVVYVSNITASNWTVNTPSGTIGISWIAVGN